MIRGREKCMIMETNKMAGMKPIRPFNLFNFWFKTVKCVRLPVMLIGLQCR